MVTFVYLHRIYIPGDSVSRIPAALRFFCFYYQTPLQYQIADTRKENHYDL